MAFSVAFVWRLGPQVEAKRAGPNASRERRLEKRTPTNRHGWRPKNSRSQERVRTVQRETGRIVPVPTPAVVPGVRAVAVRQRGDRLEEDRVVVEEPLEIRVDVTRWW